MKDNTKMKPLNKDILKKRMFENVYDILKGIYVENKKPLNEWEELSLKHYNEAKKEMKAFVRNKVIEWDGAKNIIKIGSYFTITLID